jgi:hypothetical protein
MNKADVKKILTSIEQKLNNPGENKALTISILDGLLARVPLELRIEDIQVRIGQIEGRLNALREEINPTNGNITAAPEQQAQTEREISSAGAQASSIKSNSAEFKDVDLGNNTSDSNAAAEDGWDMLLDFSGVGSGSSS